MVVRQLVINVTNQISYMGNTDNHTTLSTLKFYPLLILNKFTKCSSTSGYVCIMCVVTYMPEMGCFKIVTSYLLFFTFEQCNKYGSAL